VFDKDTVLWMRSGNSCCRLLVTFAGAERRASKGCDPVKEKAAFAYLKNLALAD
jgi:hypothetical protein